MPATLDARFTLEEFERVLKLGRGHNVRKLEIADWGVVVEYAPEPELVWHPPQTALKGVVSDAPVPQSEKSLEEALKTVVETCACGHEDAAHGPEGYCLQGCDAVKCNPPAADPS